MGAPRSEKISGDALEDDGVELQNKRKLGSGRTKTVLC